MRAMAKKPNVDRKQRNRNIALAVVICEVKVTPLAWEEK